MSKKRTFFENVLRDDVRTAYDAIITDVFPNHVNVRASGAGRKILTNVKITDHIDQSVLRPGMYCKIGAQSDRSGDRTSKFILTDILPQINYSDYAGRSGAPPPPDVFATLDCDLGEWQINWTRTISAESYELYWSTDSLGTSPVLIAETGDTHCTVPIDTSAPPKTYFAVKAIAGLKESELSAWMTDHDYGSKSAGLVTFGDGINHGHIDSSGIRWRVFPNGTVEKSLNDGKTWINVTPTTDPPNTWGESSAPTVAELEAVQVMGETDDVIYVLFRRPNPVIANAWTTWYAYTEEGGGDGGDSWTWVALNDGAGGNTGIKGYWMALLDEGNYLLISAHQHFISNTLVVQLYDTIRSHSFYRAYVMANVAINLIDDFTYYAFPVVSEPGLGDGLFYVGGRIDGDIAGVQDAEWNNVYGPCHIIEIDIHGDPDVLLVENTWGTDYCSALEVVYDAGSPFFKAVRNVIIPIEAPGDYPHEDCTDFNLIRGHFTGYSHYMEAGGDGTQYSIHVEASEHNLKFFVDEKHEVGQRYRIYAGDSIYPFYDSYTNPKTDVFGVTKLLITHPSIKFQVDIIFDCMGE